MKDLAEMFDISSKFCKLFCGRCAVQCLRKEIYQNYKG